MRYLSVLRSLRVPRGERVNPALSLHLVLNFLRVFLRASVPPRQIDHFPALQSPHMVTGIEHVAIAFPDPLRLALWYVEHLDFVINCQPVSSMTVFIKAADGSMIEIIESAPDTVPVAGMNPAGLRHLALTVADFPEVHARLKAKGVRFLADAQTAHGNSLVFFTDPDGNILHLLHRETPLP